MIDVNEMNNEVKTGGRKCWSVNRQYGNHRQRNEQIEMGQTKREIKTNWTENCTLLATILAQK